MKLQLALGLFYNLFFYKVYKILFQFGYNIVYKNAIYVTQYFYHIASKIHLFYYYPILQLLTKGIFRSKHPSLKSTINKKREVTKRKSHKLQKYKLVPYYI